MTVQNPLDNESGPEPTLFSAIITPHRSLNSTGFLVVMLLVSGFSFVAGMVFFLLGAWPVVGFLGLDVLLVYWAFRANFRAAAAFEEVVVTPSKLHVRRVSHSGRVSEWTLNPLWTQIVRDAHEEFGLLHLYLVSRGCKLPVAGFLSPPERESFATALSAALGEAKRGPTRAAI